MPEICRFYGIIIYIYPGDHNPPHIHAKYAGESSEVAIETGKIIEGNLPTTARRLVKKWVELHKDELYANWEIAQKKEQPFKITPLK